MVTISYSMAGAYDYAFRVVPADDDIADVLEQDSCFYRFNSRDTFLMEEDEQYNDNW